MTDKEILEFAAKAAGFANFEYASPESGICVELGSRRGAITSYWNPLIDDGDALRLAVKLNDYEPYKSRGGFRLSSGLKVEAQRLAIVRAAAEIGKAMQ